MPKDNADKPVKMFRRGAIAVSVWERKHEDQVFYNAMPSRAFKRKDATDNDPFEYTDNFSTDDLPTVSALLMLAFQWIVFNQSKS